MNREILDAHLTAIAGLDGEAMKGCQRAWDAIAKPIAGLGKLEEILVQIAGIQRFIFYRNKRFFMVKNYYMKRLIW